MASNLLATIDECILFVRPVFTILTSENTLSTQALKCGRARRLQISFAKVLNLGLPVSFLTNLSSCQNSGRLKSEKSRNALLACGIASHSSCKEFSSSDLITARNAIAKGNYQLGCFFLFAATLGSSASSLE